MKIVIVTGGTSGIGLEVCRVFHQNGHKVYSLSRKEAPNFPYGEHIRADVTDPREVEAAASVVFQRHGRIDVLINNAGFGISGAVEFTEPEDAKRQLDVNFFGCFNCCKAVLPVMRRQRSGVIINVSSVAAEIAIPFQAFYSASKAAVNSLTLSLANEVRDFGIAVKAVMPGDVKTGFTRARRRSESGAEVYTKMRRSVETMEKDEQNGMGAEKIAEKIYSMAFSSGTFATVGAKYKAVLLLARLLPRRLSNAAVGKIYS